MKCDKSKSMLTTTKIMSYCQQGNLPNSGSAVEEQPADLVTSFVGAVVEATSSVGAVVEATSSVGDTRPGDTCWNVSLLSPSEKINQKKV